MSVTHQESVPAGMGHAAGTEEGLGVPSHYDEKNPPSAGPEAVPLRQLMDGALLDALLERSRDEAGGLRLTGEGSMLGELVKAVLERALEAELTAHLGMNGAIGPGITAAIRATGRSPRRCRPGSGRWAWRCRGTGPGVSTRC